MHTLQGGVEPVTLSEVLSLDTWNQERTHEQLQSFIKRRHMALESVVDEDEDEEVAV